jgi:uncharacterized protein (DUF1810 family)
MPLLLLGRLCMTRRQHTRARLLLLQTRSRPHAPFCHTYAYPGVPKALCKLVLQRVCNRVERCCAAVQGCQHVLARGRQVRAVLVVV